MTRSERTSPRLAKIAARRLDDPDPEVRALAGSVLTQVQAEADGPKPRKAWGETYRNSLRPYAVEKRQFLSGFSHLKIVPVLITAIARKPSGKHAARKGK